MAKKVLVVDDEANTRKFLTVALEENGYEVVEAPDGKAGHEMARAEKPDLILLDVMMPKRTGFTLFKMLRKDEGLEKTPVIMLTAVGASLEDLDREAEDENDDPYEGLRGKLRKAIAEMKEEGIVRPEYFIEKPIDPDLVISRVQELIGS